MTADLSGSNQFWLPWPQEAQAQVEPLPETRDTLEQLVAQGDTMLSVTLLRMGRRTTSIVPECVGLSLALLDDGLTFTLAATSEVVAGLDAVQYVDGGPCVQGAHENATIDVTPEEELLGEDRWLLYAQASAAAGVRSSLTMPILHTDGHIIGEFQGSSQHLDDRGVRWRGRRITVRSTRDGRRCGRRGGLRRRVRWSESSGG